MTTTTTTNAAEFLSRATELGFSVRSENVNARAGGKALADSWLVELTTTFDAGDAAAYVGTEIEALRLLGDVPRPYAGTTWGSTSDGVGGHAALSSGSFRLCSSGVSASFAKALAKAIAR